MDRLQELFLSYEFIGVTLLIYFMLLFVRRMAPEFWTRPVPNRILASILPEVLGIAFFLLAGLIGLDSHKIWESIMLGFASAYLAPKAHHLVRFAEMAVEKVGQPKDMQQELPLDENVDAHAETQPEQTPDPQP